MGRDPMTDDKLQGPLGNWEAGGAAGLFDTV